MTSALEADSRVFYDRSPVKWSCWWKRGIRRGCRPPHAGAQCNRRPKIARVPDDRRLPAIRRDPCSPPIDPCSPPIDSTAPPVAGQHPHIRICGRARVTNACGFCHRRCTMWCGYRRSRARDNPGSPGSGGCAGLLRGGSLYDRQAHRYAGAAAVEFRASTRGSRFVSCRYRRRDRASIAGGQRAELGVSRDVAR